MDFHEDLVYDVGAHRGEDSAFYLKLGYRVVAVEANPELAAGLRERFSNDIAEGKFCVVESAIAEHPGHVVFYINSKLSIWGTTDPGWVNRNQLMGARSEAIRVASTRFADLLAAHGCPQYLKIDIEGADMLCVNDLGRSPILPRFISIESSKTSWKALVGEFDALEALGYHRFKVVNQKRHRSGEFRSRSGESIHHSFEHGASGPFGMLLPGRWRTRRSSLLRYFFIFCAYRIVGDNTFAAKVLRRIPLLRRIPRLVGWYDTHAMLTNQESRSSFRNI